MNSQTGISKIGADGSPVVALFIIAMILFVGHFMYDQHQQIVELREINDAQHKQMIEQKELIDTMFKFMEVQPYLNNGYNKSPRRNNNQPI